MPDGSLVDLEQPPDAAYVIARLEEAGRSLLALQVRGVRPAGHRSSMPEYLHTFDDLVGRSTEPSELRVSPPSAAKITEMDQALGWVLLIPEQKRVIRRIVHARCLVAPRTDRHLFSWRRIAVMVGADHKAVQRWHAQGIDMIVAALNRRRVA